MMARVYEIDNIKPVINPSTFVHPDAVLIGDCIVGANCYIGPYACLRGDFGRIEIADGCNVQDNCVIHTTPELDTCLEENAHVGHGAILHGCTIKHNALIGINSVVMDGAIIGINSFVASMSFVKLGFFVPDNVLVAGSPAKIYRELTEKEIKRKTKGTFLYEQLAARSIETMRKVQPLTRVEVDRKRFDHFSIDEYRNR